MFRRLLFSFFILLLMITACTRSGIDENGERIVPSSRDIPITELDITHFIQHKRAIDAITGTMDKKIKHPTPGTNTPKRQLLLEGKKKINHYLESKGLHPTTYMRKSAKIIRAYFSLTVYNEKNRKKSMKRIKKYSTTPKEAEERIENLNRSWKRFKKQYSDGVRPAEMKIIEKNLDTLKKVI
jgi:ubiquitin